MVGEWMDADLADAEDILEALLGHRPLTASFIQYMKVALDVEILLFPLFLFHPFASPKGTNQKRG